MSLVAFNVSDNGPLVAGPLADSVALYRTLESLNDLMDQRLDFQVKDLRGETHRLSDYRGKVVLLNFWATWCPPCIREMPLLEKLHQDNKELVILALTDEETKVVSDYVTKGGYTMPVLLDTGGKVHDLYGRRGIPHTVIINTEGRIVRQFYGMRLEEEYLAQLRDAGL